jgi:ribosomal protein S18 acetylase RimI-like enzyme
MIGYSKIIYNSPTVFVEEKQVCKLERLYILQSHYDKKLGWKLFEHNLNLAKSNQQKGFWLTVWTENNRAIKFYERIGFSTVGVVDFKVGNQYNPNYVMFLSF